MGYAIFFSQGAQAVGFMLFGKLYMDGEEKENVPFKIG